MTNITLSIDTEIYKKMKRYAEIKWSEFVRRIIKRRIEELELLEKNSAHDSILAMLASEKVLEKDWNNDEDARWDNV